MLHEWMLDGLNGFTRDETTKEIEREYRELVEEIAAEKRRGNAQHAG